MGFSDKIEVSRWSENENYNIQWGIGNDGIVTIDIEGRPGTSNEGQKMRVAFIDGVIEVQVNGEVIRFDESMKL